MQNLVRNGGLLLFGDAGHMGEVCRVTRDKRALDERDPVILEAMLLREGVGVANTLILSHVSERVLDSMLHYQKTATDWALMSTYIADSTPVCVLVALTMPLFS